MRTHVLLRITSWILFLTACIMLGIFFYLIYTKNSSGAVAPFIGMVVFWLFSFLASLAADDLDISNRLR